MAKLFSRLFNAVWNGNNTAPKVPEAPPPAAPPPPGETGMENLLEPPPQDAETADSLLVPVSSPQELSADPGADALLTPAGPAVSGPAPAPPPAPEPTASQPAESGGLFMGDLFEQVEADTDTPIAHLIASLPDTSVEELLEQVETVNGLIAEFKANSNKAAARSRT